VGWVYEVKFDGYRFQIHKVGDAIALYTRNGADWTERFPLLVASLTSLPCRSAIIDAELVHVDGFEALHKQVPQRVVRSHTHQLTSPQCCCGLHTARELRLMRD